MAGVIAFIVVTGINIWALTLSGGSSLATGYLIFGLAAGNFFFAWLLNRYGGEIIMIISFSLFVFILIQISFIVFGLINLARFIVPLVY